MRVRLNLRRVKFKRVYRGVSFHTFLTPRVLDKSPPITVHLCTVCAQTAPDGLHDRILVSISAQIDEATVAKVHEASRSKRRLVEFKEIPKVLVDAVAAGEDFFLTPETTWRRKLSEAFIALIPSAAPD